MLSDHSNQSFVDDESHLFANKHTWHMSCISQVASFVRIPLCHSISDRPPIADEEVKEVFCQSQAEDRPVSNFISGRSVTEEQKLRSKMTESHSEEDQLSISRLTWIKSVDEHVVRPEHVKRPPTTDVSHQHAYKRVRQAGCNDQLVSFELTPLDATHEEPVVSDPASNEFRNNRHATRLDPSVDAYGITSSLSWDTCSTFEEENGSDLQEPPQHFIESKHQSSWCTQLKDVYLSFLDYYPRKPVAVGPDHQADIPAWRPRPLERLSKEMDPTVFVDHVTDEDDSEKFMGTCILPMPDFTSVNLEGAKAGVSRSDCGCLDIGSIRCVKQHVMEAKEKLKRTLGENKFVELGFSNMGESVAKKWSEDEELTFHEVVSSNPASMGKNFWDHLPRCFLSKGSKDLVSYYFNVFMLRKRAEQNRSDLLDIDSDNDEWQENDDGKLYAEDYEDDSIVESPTDQDDISNIDGHEEDDSDGDDEDIDAYGDCDLNQELYHVSKGQHLQDVGEGHDIQDESCTSYEGQNDGANYIDGPVAAEYGQLEEDHRTLHGGYKSIGLGSVTDSGYINGHCDAKAWDWSYLSGQDATVDFLPTCYVIEEVFGKGFWSDEAEDGQRNR